MNFLHFILLCILVEITPGPNMTYLAIVSTQHGRKAGLFTIAGISIGLLIIGIAAVTGIGHIVAESPVIYDGLKYIGGTYLLWLAFDSWRSASTGNDTMAEIQNRHFFTRGLVTNIINPKAIVFYITVFPSFISPDSSYYLQSCLLIFTYVLIATTIHGFITILASQAHALLQNSRMESFIRRSLSVLLAIVALWFFQSANR